MIQQPVSPQEASDSSPPVSISLFGNFELLVNGVPVTSFRSNKARALLSYLMMTPHAVLRTAINQLLWDRYPESSAQASLRQILTNIRNSLAPYALLQSNRTHLHLLRNPALLRCDVHQFEELLDACERHPHHSLATCPVCRPRLQQAVALYKAPLLTHLPAIDSPPFHEWLDSQRARLAARLAEAQAALAVGNTPPGNLPPPLTPLVGRAQELFTLERHLQHSTYRCVTLIGPGGIGKTRLASALGARVQAQFPHGVWLVQLSELATVTPEETAEQAQEHLAIAIGQALNLPFYGTQPPTTQVANYLATRTTLLILDSFEHITGGASWLPILLTAAPHVQILITTRHRLPLQSQLVYPIEGLGVPPEEATERNAAHLIAQYASLQLFLERAESAGQPLPLDRTTLELVGQICRFVEGSPWAIELAVAMLHRYRPDVMWAAMRQNYRALATDLVDLPERQRSAEAVFRTTWDLLTPDEAQALARCAVFRGGFTLTAAETVAATTPTILDALVQKSLLRQANHGRYIMHDLVRQFAEEQLTLDATAADHAYTAHTLYFTALLASWQPDEATEQEFRRAVTQDWENVQAAWSRAVEKGQIALLQLGVRGLAEFYEMVGLYQESVQTLGTALARVRLLLPSTQDVAQSSSVALTACQTLLAHLLWRQIHILITAFGQLTEATALAAELMAWGRQLGDDSLTAWAYYEASMIAYYQGDYERQSELLHLALPLAQQQGDLYQQAYCLQMIGGNLKAQNQQAAAQRAFEEALILAQTVNASRLALMIGNNLGFCYYEAGHFIQAQTCFQQTLSRATEVAQHDQAANATIGLGVVSSTVGDYAAARRYLETAYQASVEMGNSIMATQLLNELADLFLETGEMSLAEAYSQRALATPAAQLQKIQWELLLVQGKIQRHTGNWTAARATYEAISTLSQQNDLTAHFLPVQTYLAAVDLAQGEVAAALTAIEPVLIRFADTPFMLWQRPQELLLIAYEILQANADPRAPGMLEQAWALVQAQLAKIDDPRLQETFLTQVPVNRALARLVEK